MGLGRKLSRKASLGVKKAEHSARVAEKNNRELHNTANTVADIADDVAAGAGLVGMA